MKPSDLMLLDPQSAALRLLLRRVLRLLLPVAAPNAVMLYVGPLESSAPVENAISGVAAAGRRLAAAAAARPPASARDATRCSLPAEIIRLDDLPGTFTTELPLLVWGVAPPAQLSAEECERLSGAVLIDARTAAEAIEPPTSDLPGQIRTAAAFPRPRLMGEPPVGERVDPALRMRLDCLPLPEVLRAAGALRRQGRWIFYDAAAFAAVAVHDDEIVAVDVTGCEADLTMVERISVIQGWRGATAVFIAADVPAASSCRGVPLDALSFELLARTAEGRIDGPRLEVPTADVALALLREGIQDCAIHLLRTAGDADLRCRLLLAHLSATSDPRAAAAIFRSAARATPGEGAEHLALTASALCNALLLDTYTGVVPPVLAAEAARDWLRSESSGSDAARDLRLALTPLTRMGTRSESRGMPV